MSFACPTCGQALAERLPPQIVVQTAGLYGMELQVAQALVAQFGRFVALARLVNSAFPVRSSDRVADRRKQVIGALQRAQAKLRARGLLIEHTKGFERCRLTFIVEAAAQPHPQTPAPQGGGVPVETHA